VIRLTFVGAIESASKLNSDYSFILVFIHSNKPVLTIVIGVALVVNGILITGTLETVIGFDVVIIVMLADVGGCGGVVLITGSIFTHFVPVDAVPP
jgi:hypothetical protein